MVSICLMVKSAKVERVHRFAGMIDLPIEGQLQTGTPYPAYLYRYERPPAVP